MSHLLVIAIMTATTTNAAATNVLRRPDSLASLTKSLALDAGTQHFALNPVAAKVSGEKKIVRISFS